MRFGMVIDLQRCVGCGACAFACKAENNTRTRGDGQSFNWADFVMKTEGTFPNVTHWVMPVLCNHCSDAPCVEGLPDGAQGDVQDARGRHDARHDAVHRLPPLPARLPVQQPRAGRRKASTARPTASSASTPRTSPSSRYWADKGAMIAGCTSSAADVAKASGAAIPALNAFVEGDMKAIRAEGVVEKCTFCYHRTSNGLQPACVEVCPSKARIFGDQDDPKSEIAQVLKAQKSFRLQEDKGTKPNVHYINKYSARA